MARPRSDKLTLQKFGPIANVEIEFGDLTLLVGPQGTGKSIALQMLKLSHDRLAIAKVARDNGLVWDTAKEFLDVYLGFGLGESLAKKSVMQWKGRDLSLPPRNRASPGEPSVFYVPAQRAMTMLEGWPRAFTDYSSAPFVVREFGLRLQQILLRSRGTKIFPSTSLKAALRRAVDDAVFHAGTLELVRESRQRELKIVHGSASLPYMAWSAGQREFAPLLLALYELLPSAAKPKHDHANWVVLEEPEMGLHPQAIVATLGLVLDLLHRGYRVVLSTHHPMVLDVVWLIRELQKSREASAKDLLHAMNLPARQDMIRMAENALSRECRVFALRHTEDGVVSDDISSLDPGAHDDATAGWGGLTGYSARIQDVVAHVVSRELRRGE